MENLKTDLGRRTSTDQVFDSLREDILSLTLLPGTKMSEAEVAARFGVSRQPVRDAFNRLGHLGLLRIRPQKATVVRGFSIDKIAEARFLRLAIEIEVVRNACKVWDDSCSEQAVLNLQEQQEAIDNGRLDGFHALDFRFHLLMCELGGSQHAIETIKSCRQKTDRLCVLSFNRDKEVNAVIEEHRQLISALNNRDEKLASDILRTHLGRLDTVVSEIQSKHAEYFE